MLENRPADCEILLSHPATYADPYDLADELRFVTSESNETLSLLNEGISASRGRIVHVLIPGFTVGSGWCDAALRLFAADCNVGSVSPCIVSGGYRHTIQGVAYSARYGKAIVRNPNQQIVAPLLGAGFYQRSALRFMQGFHRRFGAYADVELGLRLQAAGYKAAKCESRIRSSGKLRFKPPGGYLGGRLRAELSQAAHRVGFAGRSRRLLSLLAEPLNNRFGYGSLASVAGQIACHLAGRSTSSSPAWGVKIAQQSRPVEGKRAA